MTMTITMTMAMTTTIARIVIIAPTDHLTYQPPFTAVTAATAAAATAATATSQQLWHTAPARIQTRTGTKYPVRGTHHPSL